MSLILRAITILLTTFFFSTCDLINPEETIPSYISIESIDFVATTPTHGSSNHKIVEAWVSVDGVFIGVYDLPATIPVLASGATEIKVEAGIKDNGIGRLPEIYPFFEPYRVNVDLKPAEVTVLQPNTRYRENLSFALVEDFENGSNIFIDELDGNSLTSIDVTTEDVFEGNASGVIQLTGENPAVEVATDFARKYSDLQTKGVPVYLELNYKTDVEVAFGIIGHELAVFTPPEKLYEPVLFPKQTWNKVYLNLSAAVFELQTPEYQIALIAVLPPDLESGSIRLDNIKLIHF
ncbi:MAG: hypothetical protein AAF806_03055 [Bacteroidota bacterium]